MGDDDGDKNISGGGGISGIGYVSGVRCMISASDSGIKGGSMTEMGVVKALRGAEIIKENKPFKKINFKISNENAWEVGLACGGKITIFIEQIN